MHDDSSFRTGARSFVEIIKFCRRLAHQDPLKSILTGPAPTLSFRFSILIDTLKRDQPRTEYQADEEIV